MNISSRKLSMQVISLLLVCCTLLGMVPSVLAAGTKAIDNSGIKKVIYDKNEESGG